MPIRRSKYFKHSKQNSSLQNLLKKQKAIDKKYLILDG
jgi:hypothetical protein